jgi:hypothetical protein
MAVISDLDINIYLKYAQFTQLLENIQEEYHFNQADTIPAQTLLVNIQAKPSELDLLLGSMPSITPWAHFLPPARLRYLRRSPFGFARLVLGSATDEEEEHQQEQFEDAECESPEEEKQKAVLRKFFKNKGMIDRWIREVGGNMGRFLQG